VVVIFGSKRSKVRVARLKTDLKQFDGLTWLTLTRIFYDRSTPLRMDMNCAVWFAVNTT